MSVQAGFALRARNPDVLTCIANLSNDEVFTPPEFANRMLDTLAEAWSADHKGANLWADKTVKFLDPCTKSGVFLREITSRLTKGPADEMPNLDECVNHILTKQVFGIGITYLLAGGPDARPRRLGHARLHPRAEGGSPAPRPDQRDRGPTDRGHREGAQPPPGAPPAAGDDRAPGREQRPALAPRPSSSCSARCAGSRTSSSSTSATTRAGRTSRTKPSPTGCTAGLRRTSPTGTRTRRPTCCRTARTRGRTGARSTRA